MRRALVVALLVTGVAACPAPSDVTPLIHVDPRAASRLDWLGKPAASADAPAPHPARVHVMKDGEQLGGPNAIGRPGDLLLENDEVAFVVDQLGSSSGFAETGGNVVDAADAKARKDELGQIFAYFGTFPRQGVYDTLTSGTDPDGSAWVEARGHELYEPQLAVVTRYTLHPPDRALLIETTLVHTGGAGTAPIELPSIGDAVQWGGAEKVAPGRKPGFKGPSSGPYLGGVGRFTSYAITSTEGAVDAVSGSSWSDTAQRKGVRLAPGERTQYARVFVVGARPDTSSFVAELTLASGQPVGTLRVKPSSTWPGMRVSLRLGATTEPMTLAAPFEATVPPGSYAVTLAGSASAGASADVKPDGVAEVDLPAPAAGGIDVACRTPSGAPMPCKVTFEGQGGTPSPDFGPTHVAGPARNQATTADGAVSVTLLPGSYRLTASRGPEYALAQADVTVDAGARKAVTLSVPRVVDTGGYLGCDFHQHTMLGTDAPTSPRDRVVSNVAEGVDVAVATEHNVVADLSPLVKELHLDGELVALSGDELTTDASRHPWGHVNVWPLARDANRSRGGAPVVRDRPPKDVFDELRRGAPTDVIVQINHPRSGMTGYFDQLSFDPARGVGTDAAYDAEFDAVEIWNGRNAGPRGKVLEDWRALLRAGHPVTPTADTDTHGVVDQEAGYPRTYVRVGDDTMLSSWSASRTADLVRGVKTLRDVVLTNGPMLRVSVGGAPIGGLARARAGRVKVDVHVEVAPWVDVDSIRIFRIRTGAEELTKAVHLAPLPSGALAADLSFSIEAIHDDAVTVVATGSKPMTPVLSGDPVEITPWAMTGPVWIDADGDGKSLGR